MGWGGTLLIVRSLSLSAWGQFSFVFNVLSLLYIITNAVTPRVAIRGLLDWDDPGRFAGNYVVLRGFLGTIGYGVAMGFVLIGGYPPIVVRTMAVAGLLALVASTADGYDIIFQVRNRMQQPALAQVVGQAAQLISTIVLALVGAGIVAFTTPAILGEIVILAWTARAARRLLRIRYTVILSTWGTLIRTALPVAIGQGFFALYSNVDSVLLSKLQTFDAVGVYSVAYKFSNVILMAGLAMSAAAVGALVQSWPDAVHVFWATVRRSFLLLFMIGVAASVEFGIFATPVVKLLYGTQYGAAATPARLVVVGSCLSFFTMLMTTVLSAQGRNRLYVAAGVGGLVFNVAANLWVIPRWSYTGAAWVTVVTELIVISFVLPGCLREHLGDALPLRECGWTSVCGLVALGVGLGLYAWVPWFIALLASTIVYLVLLHVSRVPGPQGLGSLLHDEPLTPEPAAPSRPPLQPALEESGPEDADHRSLQLPSKSAPDPTRRSERGVLSEHLAEFEVELCRLPGVIATRFVGGCNGRPLGITVLVSPGTASERLRANVAAIGTVHFGISLDSSHMVIIEVGRARGA